MSDSLYIEKELSWLSFNQRVLQEAQDHSVPIIERVRFLGIFSNNQDEFYKVRVAALKRRIILNELKQKDDGSIKLLSDVQAKLAELQQDFDETYREIILTLARRNIFLINEDQLSDNHQNWVRKYFKDKVLRHITPIVITKRTDLVRFLKDEYTYLAVEVKKGDKESHLLIEIPTDTLPRFVVLPPDGSKTRKTMIILDNIIRFCLDDLLRGFYEYDTISAYSIKMTRDADYDLTDEVDQGLLEKMSGGIKQRLTAEPVRFVYDREMPNSMIKRLSKMLHISKLDHSVSGSRYHNFKDFIGFPNVGRKYLENNKIPALNCRDFDSFDTVFDAISARDILLYYPYHKFRYISEFVRQASFDPKVSSIKINIYRVAKKSHLMNSLIDAANNGKRVTVVIELRARFDEGANIGWAQMLTDAGVKVVFGVPSLKVHSKLLLVTRKEGDQRVFYSHIGTGNFHEKTAKIYTDFALFTKNQEIGQEVENVFRFIQQPYRRFKFQHLIVSPNDTRRRLFSLIDYEINQANLGHPAAITIKVNNLVDKGLVTRLYAASKAGVKIRMVIRGMCSLVPGLEGVSDNIRIISIVDRFLEHPRVFHFHHSGEDQVYIASFDWMTRNIEERVEVGVPIYDEELKQRVIDLLELQFADTTKARVLDGKQQNLYVSRGNRRKIRSQIWTHDYLKAIESKPRRVITSDE
ncbi:MULTISPECIES: polyphosphate kinase 1 [unclassified Agarivorans]|uniref:polyphosphate kinase 1 n=1 Tax=unclassified Agarivorans TaxID=2636026 RepID=UPI0010D3483B|nr:MULTISPECIES: polyphosphate kinase 1 [unclassified Agarivorans]MDO6686179.1 polyphosphate kinase 1 [Agarivorans sp. 3_MG-2023]MDO6716372.1 polyphosphate kinase 1 [Agarivorans sp. 2_MG-2023]MDO6764712.1 polyphosphate kinase 1 [Agarivorans sp. 1_MG-2023]GDY24240.1 polyphosphate kinase [Agarivorans sp. Toyoura001]